MIEFDRSEPVTLSLEVRGGTAEVRAEETATVTVEITAEDGTDAAGRCTVELDGDVLAVHSREGHGDDRRRVPRLHVAVRLPQDSIVRSHAGSADVTLLGRYATVSAESGSGDLRLDTVTGDAHLKAGSGNMTVTRIGGALQAGTSSGAIGIVDVTGDVNVSASSGDITVDRAAASLRAGTSSGTVRIGALAHGRARIKASSGDVTVGVLPGTAVWLDLNTSSGRTSSDLPVGSDAPTDDAPALELRVTTASGNIAVRRAAPTTSAVA